jgi:AcrR family transcriptional regulator
MPETTQDRRIVRTQQALTQALVDLIQEQRYETITVQDITERANVGRSTFYVHYLDKDDLLTSTFTQMLDELFTHLHPPGEAAGQPVVPLSAFFAHVHGHASLYKALVRGGGIDLIHKTGQRHLSTIIEGRLQAHPALIHDPVRRSLIAAYLAGNIFTMLAWWITHDQPYPPEQMEAFFQQSIHAGVLPAIKPPD